MTNSVNIRVMMPKKYHKALAKKSAKGKSIREQVKLAAMRELIASGLVKPSKIDREMCGME